MVSLVMLKVSSAQQFLQVISSDSLSRASSAESALYLQNPDAIQELNDVFSGAAKQGTQGASLAILAWSIILQTLREFANVSNDGRRLERSEPTADAYDSVGHGEDEGHEETLRRERSSIDHHLITGGNTSPPPTFLEEMLEKVNTVQSDGDFIAYLAKKAVDEIHVFVVIAHLALEFCMPFGTEHQGRVGLKMRLSLLELIRSASDFIAYQSDILSATLAVLTGSDRYWDTFKRPKQSYEAEPAFVFLNDQFLMETLFTQARSRFPYESLPFLELCRALAISRASSQEDRPSLKSTLDNMTSFTCALPSDIPSNEQWKDGMPHRELASDLVILSDQPMQKRLTHSSAGSDLDDNTMFQLPAGTAGVVVSNDNNFIVMWHYRYSGLSYMGQLLRGALNIEYAPSNSNLEESILVTAEIIGLISALLMSTCQWNANGVITSKDVDRAQAVLEEASTGLNRNQDIISVVFAIFEKELHKSPSMAQGEDSIDVLMRCNEFMHALLIILPARVWSFLSRSSLLGLDGKESRLSSVVASTEIVSGRFGFLSGFMWCCESLVDDAVTNAVSRKAKPVAKTRFGQRDNGGSGLSEVSMKKVLLHLTRITVDVFESIDGWKFELLQEKLEINATVSRIMHKILQYCFGMDDNPNLGAKLIGSLAPAAEHLMKTFLPQSNVEIPIQPFLRTLLEGVSTEEQSIFVDFSARQKAQTIAILKLSGTLTKVRTYIGCPPGLFEKALIKSSSLLIKLYAVNEVYRVFVLELFESLIQGFGSQDDLPPSLVASCGSSLVRLFVELLGVFDTQSDNRLLSVAIWRFASAVVSQRQQWFAIYLLTGSTPRQALKGNDLSKSITLHEVLPLLRIAIDRLSMIDKLKTWEAINILEFVKSAADFWPWVLTSLKEGNFLTSASAYLTSIDRSAVSDNDAQTQSEEPQRLQAASLVVSILAMYVHACREKGDISFATKLQSDLTYLFRNAVAAPKYNGSLHSNLRKNFELKFPQCNLSDFKRTSFEQPPLGHQYYYNTQMADRMLSFDPAWSGKAQQGFAEELSRANFNLSIVEGHVVSTLTFACSAGLATDSSQNLLHSWEFLAVELSFSLKNDAKFHTTLIAVIHGCLHANAEDTLPDPVFRKLAQSRADLAFALAQQALKIVPRSTEAKSILEPTWNALRLHASALGTALVGSDANYDRTLLKLLCVALQIHALGKSKPEDRRGRGVEAINISHVERIVLEILGTVVAQGFRSLTTALHDDVSKVLPMDFALINAILRTALCIHDVEGHSIQLVSQFADDQTARYAATLLSWSDQLTINNDPVYGELSIMFLTELCAAPALAESIAVEGILAQISNAALMGYFRRPRGIGPSEEPIRMHRIWSRGVLPLALNLLKAIGAPISGEISGFLAQFQNQISRTANSFDFKANGNLKSSIDNNCFTINLASEAHSLALVTTILDSFREAGPSIGINAVDITNLVWDKAQMREDLLSWMQQRKALRENIIATNEREEAWAREKPLSTDNGAENRLEEKIVAEFSATITILGDLEV